MKNIPNVLTIAGSDSSGGAGIQADIKTFSALNVYGSSVLTNITSQNTKGVQSIFSLPAQVVQDQLKATLSDIKFDAIKIGMLYSESIINVVAEYLSRHPDVPIILDPILISSSGMPLLESSAKQALISNIFPLATLITPNLPESDDLLITSPKFDLHWPAEKKACTLSKMYNCDILVKGGHGQGDILVDHLCTEGILHSFSHKRIRTNNTHGTGCTLSSAIAAYKAKDCNTLKSVKLGIQFTDKSIEMSKLLSVGEGYGPVNQIHHDI